MFLTPKVFNFNVYHSLEWSVRQPLHDYHPTNRVNVRHLPTISLSKPNRYQSNQLFFQSISTAATSSLTQQKKSHFKHHKYGLENSTNKPRTITIIKQGNEKPHKTITILLNRRTAQTFEQLLSDISESFGYQKHRNDKIKRLYTLKGRQVNGINDFFRDDEIFIASINTTDISVNDLQEINLEILNDPQHSVSRRNYMKQTLVSIEDRDTPSTQMAAPMPISVDVKKTANIRDSGFLDDEDMLSSRNSEAIQAKVNETVSEHTVTPTDLINRKIKKALKPISTTTVEQQREKERQRLREEDDRRRKLLLKKDHHLPLPITSVPKFEQLLVDNNQDDTNKTKPEQSSVPIETPVLKQFIIKKRSTILHPSPSIVTDKYEFGKKMGDGNFAIVRRSKARELNREVAVKIIDKSKMKGKEYMIDHEINIMYMCNHPNIIRVFEDYETPDEIYLIMELIKGGDLFDYITKHRRFDEITSSLMIKDIGEAILYLHAKKIVHRDLKPENLLVMQRKDGRITIKLTDFGLAMQVNGPIKTVCGTPTYVAPEILAESGYGLEVDCWATGVILYILLCGYPPFKTSDRNQEELFQMIQRGKYNYDCEHWTSVSSNAKDLIDHLLVVDRQKRMRADEILLHPWILTVGQSKSIRHIEELKTTIRAKYDMKIQDYANENTSTN